MSTQNIQVGDTVPIELVLADGANDQYPRAFVFNQSSTPLITIDLLHDTLGNYSGNTYVMPNTEFVKVVYIVYSDSGHLTINEDYEYDIEVFYRILPDEFKANVALLALEATSQTILADTEELQLNQGDWLTAVGFAIPNEYDTRMTALQADLDDPNQYKATGFAVANEYDTPLANIQSEVDGLNGDAMRGTDGANTVVPPTTGQIDSALIVSHGGGSWQTGDGMTEASMHDALDSYANKTLYMANVANLDTLVSSRAVPGEYDLRMANIQTDLDTPDQYKATGFGVAGEYDIRMIALQADLDNPDQYKATGFATPNEYDARMAELQATILRTLGLTQENQFIDNTFYAGKNLLNARLRIYSDAVSVGTDLNVLAAYNIAATYTAAGMQTYSMVKA